MQQHVKILGILHLVFSAMGAVVGLVVLVLVLGGGLIGGLASSEPQVILITMAVAIGVGGFLILVSLPGMVAGWFVLQYREWARILTLILAVLNLMNFPFGTALGIYAFWVLLHPETEHLFARGGAEVPLGTGQPPRLL